MIPIQDLFESHLTVTNLDRSMHFFGRVLGLERAFFMPDRRVAFYWIGQSRASMVGIWETEDRPLRINLHLAFAVALGHLLEAPDKLKAAGITPLDFWGAPSDEPVVIGWMPAAAVYFRDPDGNLLEFLSTLSDAPAPEAGIVTWSRWLENRQKAGADN